MIVVKRLIPTMWAKSWLLAKSPSEQVLPGRRGTISCNIWKTGISSPNSTVPRRHSNKYGFLCFFYMLQYSHETKLLNFLTKIFARLPVAFSFFIF